MEPGTYDTDTSGMARAHRIVENALAAGPAYVRSPLAPDRVAAVASFYDNLFDYLRVHHESEDELLYPRLEERCPGERQSIALVGSQHHLLDEPMRAAIAAIGEWRTDPTDSSSAVLIHALSVVLEVLAPHCRDEESVILPLARRYVSFDEWHELLTYERRNFRLDKPWLVLGLAMEQGDDARRAALLAMMPETRRDQWLEEWSGAYQAFMAKVRT
ncbi:MAG: hemerythrin domain-containing protein [Acidobacteriota bacterium]|nr:hemerythrin domain-containing protein [Acidobacteriota bacterium]